MKSKYSFTFIGLPTAFFFCYLSWAQLSSAQWIAYNFSPQAAYQASYGLTTNTNSISATIVTNGWPTNWNNSTNRGILAVQFSTNTNTPNVMTCLDPLIYLYRNSTNTLSTNNYTNIPQITLINNSNTGANSYSNACYIARANFSRNVYMSGQYSLIVTNVGTNVGTNTVGTFNSPCTGYTTTTIGTNGVPIGTNFYPSILQLKISSINGSNAASSFNQQLVLPLTINTALTKIINTNATFGSAALTDTNVMYNNLVNCIRSNSTYINP
jgi:hypothetical protein